MNRLNLAIAPVAACAAMAFVSAPARAERLTDPLRFFEGRTESTSTVGHVRSKGDALACLGVIRRRRNDDLQPGDMRKQAFG